MKKNADTMYGVSADLQGPKYVFYGQKKSFINVFHGPQKPIFMFFYSPQKPIFMFYYGPIYSLKHPPLLPH